MLIFCAASFVVSIDICTSESWYPLQIIFGNRRAIQPSGALLSLIENRKEILKLSVTKEKQNIPVG